MRTFYIPLIMLAAVLTLDSCSSGKSAYKHGDYYEAVLTSVQRLRQNPDHKKSKEVLEMSYSAAVEYLEADAQNQINSNANFKYSAAVADYEKINNLYEQIRTSPGALSVVPKPIAKHKELAELKLKASEECYEAGVQALMKNTRQDAKNAFFLFTDAARFTPGYRESTEMIEQARDVATLRVVVVPGADNYYGWNFESVLHGFNGNQFVRFYTQQQADAQALKRVDQFVRVSVNSYTEGRPTINRRVEDRSDSVKTGEKTVNGAKVPVYEKVSAKVTVFEKSVTARGSINLIVADGMSRAEVYNQEISAEKSWTDSWAIFTGDKRALTSGNQKLIEKREANMGKGYLQSETKKDLDAKLASTLSSYYNSY
jgi:hypothetical protein